MRCELTETQVATLLDKHHVVLCSKLLPGCPVHSYLHGTRFKELGQCLVSGCAGPERNGQCGIFVEA